MAGVNTNIYSPMGAGLTSFSQSLQQLLAQWLQYSQQNKGLQMQKQQFGLDQQRLDEARRAAQVNEAQGQQRIGMEQKNQEALEAERQYNRDVQALGQQPSNTNLSGAGLPDELLQRALKAGLLRNNTTLGSTQLGPSGMTPSPGQNEIVRPSTATEDMERQRLGLEQKNADLNEQLVKRQLNAPDASQMAATEHGYKMQEIAAEQAGFMARLEKQMGVKLPTWLQARLSAITAIKCGTADPDCVQSVQDTITQMMKSDPDVFCPPGQKNCFDQPPAPGGPCPQGQIQGPNGCMPDVGAGDTGVQPKGPSMIQQIMQFLGKGSGNLSPSQNVAP